MILRLPGFEAKPDLCFRLIDELTPAVGPIELQLEKVFQDCPAMRMFMIEQFGVELYAEEW